MKVISTGKRQFLKAITWRIVSVILTFVIVYWLTGGIDAAMQIGVADFAIKFVVYYGHEKLWKKTEWGKKIVPCK